MARLIEIGDTINSHTPNTQDIHIARIEDLSKVSIAAGIESRRTYYKISLVKGHSRIQYADLDFEISAFALVFTHPFRPYIWDRISAGQEGFVCMFTGEFITDTPKLLDYPVFKSSANAVIEIDERMFTELSSIFQRMKCELDTSYRYKYDMLRNLITELVLEALKLKPTAGVPVHYPSASERTTELFLDLLERQFPVSVETPVILHTPSAFADSLNIHVNHLNKSLKEVTGKTTSRHIAERIYQEAKRLLQFTSKRISEVAWSLGFDETHNFSSFFKSFEGLTPRNFRSRLID